VIHRAKRRPGGEVRQQALHSPDTPEVLERQS
jgi:hypothetical protein